jgi:hypothetical protein
MTNEGSKCQWVSSCPCYERQGSYGTEIYRCANTDCSLYDVYKDEESEEEE